MIGGLARHGCGHEVLELFRKMNADCETRRAFILGSFLDDGRRRFSAMRQEYGIEPTVVHCNYMVDLFGRAGLLDETKLFMDDIHAS